jgi:hypothetical protein
MLRRLWAWLTRDLGPLCPHCRQPVDPVRLHLVDAALTPAPPTYPEPSGGAGPHEGGPS